MNVWTKRGVDIVAPTDAAGNPRKVVNGEMQTWMTEVERLFNTGAFNSVDAVGLYADRSTFDGEAEGFVYVSIDGDGAGSSSAVAFIKESAASGDWSPPVPFQGDKGWSPLFRAASDGARRVLEVYDWVGGDGEKPATVGFVGAAGLTPNIAEAIDIRGPQGVSGTGLSWSFDDGTADADPGAGKLRADAADLSAATELFVSKTSAGGDLLASFLAGLTNSTSTHKGYLIVTDPLTASQATFDVTGTTDAAGYVKLAVSGHSGALAFADAALLSVVFSRTGNAGDLNGVNPGTAGLAVLGDETPADVRTTIGALSKSFLASTSSGAIAGAVSRDVVLKLSDSLNGRDFGITADGVTDDTSAMVAAFAAMEATGSPLFLPAGTIMVEPDALFIGDGSASQVSTTQAPMIFGAGNAPYTGKGTVIKARNAGTLLFEVNGLLEGVHMNGVVFDCAGVVLRGVDITAMCNSTWDSFSVLNWTAEGLRLINRTAPVGGVTWSARNRFSNFLIASEVNGDYSSGLYLSGTIDPVSPPGPHDPHQNLFSCGTVQVAKRPVNASRALFAGFTDSNQFHEVDFVAAGAGNGYPAVLSDLNNVGYPYPQNNLFIGCSMQGAEPLVIGDIGENYFIGYPTKDGETVPANNKLRGFTDEGRFFGPHQIEILGDMLSFIGASSANRSIRFETPDGVHSAKLVHNSSLGLELQIYSGGSYEIYFRITPSGEVYFNIPGVGLRHIQAGLIDSAGSGFRQLRVPN